MSALYLWVSLCLALSTALIWWFWRRPAGQPAVSRTRTAKAFAPAPRLPAAGAAPPAESPDIPAAEPTPPELAALTWRREADLTTSERSALVVAMADITRPPGPLLQLLSPDFIASASAEELSDLIMAEPLVAARLLGQVNSPLYGLRHPVTDIGQAVALLGMTTVRSICVQYMLAQSFQPASPSRQRVLDTLWRSSAIASELSVYLGRALNLPDRGTLPTRAVLGFVGPVATASLLSPEELSQCLALPREQRALCEQTLLGLSSGEIGGLLMASWDLPKPLIDEVCGAARLLGQPADNADPATAPRLALSYLCAHLAERLTSGQLTSLAGHDFMQEPMADTHYLRRYLNQSSLHLRSYLGHPAAARLQAALQAPELLAAVQRMRAPPSP
jgi:HD-like signal output (HDOD) protein